MQTLRVSHEFDCDEATYWDCFFDDEYNRRLFLEELRFPSFKLVRKDVTEKGLSRTVEITPRVDDVPAILRKAVGDRFGYVEEGTFDRASSRYTLRIVPAALADRTTITGEMWLEKIGAHRVRRIATMCFEVKMFGVGSLLEERTAADTRKSYEVAADFTRRFIAEKKPAPDQSAAP